MEVKPGGSAELRLKRYLHYGREDSLYMPGDRFFQSSFLIEKLMAIETLLNESPPEKHGDPVSHIIKAFMDGYSGYSECLVFALAVCAKQKISEKLRSLAYEAVKTVCKTPKDLFLFVTFTKKLSSPTSKGFGNGWRSAIIDWYLKKEPMELAECVSLFKGEYSWTHRDLLKLSHIKTENKVKATILKYVMMGLEAAKMGVDDQSPEMQQVLAYLQVVEDLKHLEDEQAAARLIEIHKLPLRNIPCNNLLKSGEVWQALVPHMPLPDLLDSIIRLGCLRLLKPDQMLEELIVNRMADQAAVVESKLHPTQVFIALRNYEEHAKNKVNLLQKLIQQGKLVKEIKPAPKPNPKIIAALHKLILSTFKLLVPTGMRYFIALDLSPNMILWKCNNERDVKPAEAAVLLALCLMHAERDVTVATFPVLPGPPPEEGIGDHVTEAFDPNKRTKGKKVTPYQPKTELRPMTTITLNKNLDVLQNLENLKEVPSGAVEVGQPMVWAKDSKIPVDVFIVITDYVTKRKREVIEPVDALKQYREAMNLPNTKLVTCALVAKTLDVANTEDGGMLDVVGFDGKMARIIEAFSRGAF